VEEVLRQMRVEENQELANFRAAPIPIEGDEKEPPHHQVEFDEQAPEPP